MEVKSIAQIDDELKKVEIDRILDELKLYSEDNRKGVQKLIHKYKRKYDEYNKIKAKYRDMNAYEDKYYAKGYKYIAGIDEVGRGPLAGPVVTAAVILPKDEVILGLDDSKKLSEAKRNELYEEIQNKAIAISIGIMDVDTIDEINILQATYRAMQQSIQELTVRPDIVLVDAVKIPNIEIEQEPIVKGDAKSNSIAAASIIAKVYRDAMMCKYDELYPEYKYSKNKGYGTKEHIEAIVEHGICPIHRKTFVKNIG